MNELLETELYHLINGRHGRFLANPQDMYMGRSMIKYGEFSEIEWQLLGQLVKPGAIVIEAGANMGTFTVPLAKNAGRQGMVYAFEPQLSVFQQLCANIALNDLVNVQAFNAGCGAEPNWMNILRPDPSRELNFGGLPLEKLKGDSLAKVRIEKLDDVIDPPRLNLIKADVEGMELPVLKGAGELIGKFRPLLYLECHEDDGPALIRHVEELDYDMWWHLPMMYNPNNHTGDTENVFGRISSKNILCAPKEKKMTVNGARPVADENDHPAKWSA
ncbi:MAG: FkbM family methyltransferase [Pseudomonadota bacterium]